MMDESQMVSFWEEWLHNLETAIAMASGEDACEASRMVLSILSIFCASSPEACTEDMFERSRVRFEEAISCIEGTLTGQPDRLAVRYISNIRHRIETLKDVERTKDKLHTS